jgi:histidinol-phosphate phosphatase family protein
MTATTDLRYAVVVPTVGRPSLTRLLSGLARARGPAPVEVLVVDDRPGEVEPLTPEEDITASLHARVLRGFGRGPAAARNLGWRVTTAPWVAFLDDDVELPDGWRDDLLSDLAACAADVAASQGRLHVPLPQGRRPTDWERSTAGLQTARWATADMAYRREALVAVQGFDERFPRAYREDADLALRVQQAGWRLRVGARTTTHPVRPADDAVSVRVQRGNADDALMARLHGPDWRQRAGTGRGRFRWHAATVASALAAVTGLAASAGSTAFRGRGATRLAGVGAVAWLGLTADFARIRIAPGPRDRAEVRRMLVTSAAIPVAAVWHRARGQWRHRSARPWPPPLRAVLFDRDGTLVHDVPYNGDPALVKPVDGATEALESLRRNGVSTGVITNQSGVGRGLLDRDEVDAVNARIDALLGPFDTWQVCPHAPEDRCSCRKPRPGMVLAAAHDLRLDPGACAVVGDIGADVEAARAAGARAVLVPTGQTLAEEVRDSPVVATDLVHAVALLLGSQR